MIFLNFIIIFYFYFFIIILLVNCVKGHGDCLSQSTPRLVEGLKGLHIIKVAGGGGLGCSHSIAISGKKIHFSEFSQNFLSRSRLGLYFWRESIRSTWTWK